MKRSVGNYSIERRSRMIRWTEIVGRWCNMLEANTSWVFAYITTFFMVMFIFYTSVRILHCKCSYDRLKAFDFDVIFELSR